MENIQLYIYNSAAVITDAADQRHIKWNVLLDFSKINVIICMRSIRINEASTEFAL